MELQKEYRVHRGTWRDLIMSTSNPVTWEPVDAYFKYKLQLLLERLEHCSEKELPHLQGQVLGLRSIIELPSKALKEAQH